MKSLKANIHDTVMPRQGISNVGMQIECIMHGTVFATHKHANMLLTNIKLSLPLTFII